MVGRRKSVRSRARDPRFGIEGLERRDCPAVVSIVGPREVSEAGGPVTLTATLSAPQTKPVEVSYFTGGTASVGLDYRLLAGTSALRTPSGTITFRPGVTSVPITFTPLNDTLRDPDETFQMNLISARGHTLGAKTVSVTIRDDDSYTAMVTGPSWVSANTTARFTLRLSSPATRTETFFVSTEDRSATTARDYGSLKNLPVTFLPGQISRDFNVVIRPAAGALPDRSFVITVRPQAAGVPAVAPYTVTIAGTGTPPSAPAGPVLTTATFTQDYGWGVVNASASVATLLGSTTAFPEVPDIGGVSWGNEVVRAPEVWAQGYTGKGIVVAVIDTGVDYTHPSLSSSIWVNPREIPGDEIDNDNNGFVDDVRGWDFASDDNDPMDEVSARGGHGTHVAGTIAAVRTADGPRGIAPDAKIMPVRFFGTGNPSDDDLAGCIRYAASNGATVINLSLGYRYSFSNPVSWPSVVTRAISYATSLGSVVVAAAGNALDDRPPGSSPDFPASLATMPGVVSVGAIDKDLRLGDFSFLAGSSSAMKHVVAPGVNVRSTVPSGYKEPGNVVVTPTGVTFADLPGTSMAAPHVSGVVALMLSALPNPKAPGVRDRVVNALVTTSQQPPGLSSTTAASASMRSAAAVATAQRPGQASLITRPMPMAFQAATPAAVVKPQAFVPVEVERGHHTSAARAIAFRALAASSDVAEPRQLSRLTGARRLI
ncbi:MAG: S8 family serine peptidase [Planctomycetia bacterium]|nr:S8 family serine peptidase [Planctomycetia bacterium]